MSQTTAEENSFASGRYSKRKRTQVVYCLEELEVDDSESDYETPQLKKRKSTAAFKPLPKREIFPFLELPAEVRNIIYGYALTDPSGICFVRATKHRRRTVQRVTPKTMAELVGNSNSIYYEDLMEAGDEKRTLVPSLLAVNSQIFFESTDILYSNEFIFEDTSALYSFLINLGPTGAPLLQKIALLGFLHGRSSKGYNHACFAALVWATNLTRLTIDTFRGWYRSTQRYAEQIYRDAFPWLEAVGMAQHKADAAIDIIHMSDECFKTFYGGIPGNMEEFRSHLSKLLTAQQKRVTGILAKKKRTNRKSTAEE